MVGEITCSQESLSWAGLSSSKSSILSALSRKAPVDLKIWTREPYIHQFFFTSGKESFVPEVDLKIWTSRESPNYVSPFPSKRNLEIWNHKNTFLTSSVTFLQYFTLSQYYNTCLKSSAYTALWRHKLKGEDRNFFWHLQVRAPHHQASLSEDKFCNVFAASSD